MMLTWVVPLLMSLSTLCDSTASATLQLEGVEQSFPDLDAYFMSRGPSGAALPVDAPDSDSEVSQKSHYLRVTFYSCERGSWITIDDIVELGRGCSRKLAANYVLDFRKLWPLEHRTLGCGKHKTVPSEPDIVWVNSRTFELRKEWSIIVVEHRGGSEFEVTVRARMDG
jgi:hypothetical protein